MKKILIFLLAAVFFTACKDNKANTKPDDKKAVNKEKDDYRNRDTNSTNDSKESQDNDDNNNSDNSDNWTKSDETAWMKICSDKVIEKMGEDKTHTYCSCMMDKLKIRYPTYAELNRKGTYEEGEEIGKKCVKEMGLSQDKNSNEENTNANTSAGWPQNEKNSFMINCEEKARASGRSRRVSQSYCRCMMDKMESLYPDINDAGKLTHAEIERIITRYKDKCLEEH